MGPSPHVADGGGSLRLLSCGSAFRRLSSFFGLCLVFSSLRFSSFLALPAFGTTNAPPIAFEFRHESWFTDEIYAILRQHNAALCIAESDDLLTPEVHTATDCACYRLRRSGGYSPVELDAFAKRFAALAENRNVYVYFKHEDEPTGALNASAFLERAAAGKP